MIDWMPTEGGNQGVVKFKPPVGVRGGNVYWCHECQSWRDTKRGYPNDGDERACSTCGETILCDECGQPYTDDHMCGSNA